MSLISENIKTIRRKAGITQEQFAEKIGIKRSLVGAYEEGRAEPAVERLILISNVFNISLEALLTKNLNDLDDGSYQKQSGTRILAVAVDNDNNEYVNLVPGKAAAGYLNGYADPEYVAELPKIHLPQLKGGTFRAFEISGDSMLPVKSGTIIIGRYLEDISSVQNGRTYVLLTKSEGVVYKRVYLEKQSKGQLTLKSDNQSYDPYTVAMSDIEEIWEAKLFVSADFPAEPPDFNNLLDMVKAFEKELIKHISPKTLIDLPRQS